MDKRFPVVDIKLGFGRLLSGYLHGAVDGVTGDLQCVINGCVDSGGW